jgi:DhnA family fructose-bisphosphate aldolase class Ia
MTSGKTLRFRRIFTKGRALIAGPGPLSSDTLQRVRLLARAGLDAVVLTPGMLDTALEELGPLSVILRLDGGPARRQFLGVPAALVLGADGVLIDLTPEGENLARVCEDACRYGVPLFVSVGSESWPDGARLAADFGADVILTPHLAASADYRQFARSTGRPCLDEVGEAADPASLLRSLSDAMQAGVQGLVLAHSSLLEPHILGAIHALVHQGVSAEEALSMVLPSPATR